VRDGGFELKGDCVFDFDCFERFEELSQGIEVKRDKVIVIASQLKCAVIRSSLLVIRSFVVSPISTPQWPGSFKIEYHV
jgi:hypothetical protein